MATYKNRYGRGVPGAAAPSTISTRRNDGQSSRRPITQYGSAASYYGGSNTMQTETGRGDAGNLNVTTPQGYGTQYGAPGAGGVTDWSNPNGAGAGYERGGNTPAPNSTGPWAGGIPDGYNSDEMAAMISQLFGDQLGGGVRDTSADEELIRQMMAGEVGGNLADLNARMGGMGFADSGASAALSGDIYQQGARTAAEDIMGLRQRARDDYQDQIAQAAQILFGERELGMSEDYYATIQQYIDSLMGGDGGGQDPYNTSGTAGQGGVAGGELKEIPGANVGGIPGLPGTGDFSGNGNLTGSETPMYATSDPGQIPPGAEDTGMITSSGDKIYLDTSTDPPRYIVLYGSQG